MSRARNAYTNSQAFDIWYVFPLSGETEVFVEEEWLFKKALMFKYLHPPMHSADAAYFKAKTLVLCGKLYGGEECPYFNVLKYLKVKYLSCSGFWWMW